MSRPRPRITLDVNQQVRDQLDLLVTRTNAGSLTEVIRRALTLYEAMTGRTDGRLIWRRTDGVEEGIVVL